MDSCWVCVDAGGRDRGDRVRLSEPRRQGARQAHGTGDEGTVSRGALKKNNLRGNISVNFL